MVCPDGGTGQEIQLYMRDASGNRTDVSLPEMITKVMEPELPSGPTCTFSQSRDGELFVTSRQDGWIRMLVP